MRKKDLLKAIAETGYNVGFGAKKHFATYDIINKIPGFISFITMTIGIYALVIDDLNTKIMAATLTIIGIIALYINFYEDKKNSYEQAGIELTQLFNKLKNLYMEVKSVPDDENHEIYTVKWQQLEDESYNIAISKQILMSNWYAHYKFFWEHQISWIDEQLKFSFWRDKVPLSFSFTSGILLIIFIYVI